MFHVNEVKIEQQCKWIFCNICVTNTCNKVIGKQLETVMDMYIADLGNLF